MKKFITMIIMTALLLTCLSGCIIIQKSDPTENGTVVARVNGEAITYDEFYAIYGQYVEMYAAYGYDENDPANAEMFEEIRQGILDELVLEKVLLQQCSEKGYLPLSEADKQEVTELLQADIDAYKESIIANAKANDGENLKTDAEYEALAEEELLKFYETTSTYNELFVYKTNDFVINKLKSELTKDITVSDTEVEEYYTQSLADQKEAFEDAAEYEYTYASGETIFYNPEGYRVVSHILLQISTDASNTIKALRTEAASAKTSAEKETDETKKAEYLATEKAKTDEADKALADALKALDTKLAEVMTKINEGEKFTDLIDEYSSDSNNYGEGYLVGPETTDFVASFTAEALRLQAEGEISSTAIVSDYGYHILKLDKLIPAGDVPLADLKASITETLLSDKITARWQAIQTDLKAAATVDIFTEVLTPSASPKVSATANA